MCEGAACPSLLAQCVVRAAPDAAAAAVLAEPSRRNQPARLGQALALCPCPVPPLMRGQLQAHEHLAFLCCLFRLRVDKSKASSGSGWCCCSATRVPPHAGDLCPSGASSCTSLSWLPGLLAQGGWVQLLGLQEKRSQVGALLRLLLGVLPVLASAARLYLRTALPLGVRSARVAPGSKDGSWKSRGRNAESSENGVKVGQSVWWLE